MSMLARRITAGLTALLITAALAEAQAALHKGKHHRTRTRWSALIVSVNYERYFTPRIGVGVGVGVARTKTICSYRPTCRGNRLAKRTASTSEPGRRSRPGASRKRRGPRSPSAMSTVGNTAWWCGPSPIFPDKGRGRSGVWPGFMFGARF